MAKGRMINKSISKSKKFNLILDNDFDRLFYCMLLPYADRDGRLEGDPDLVKGNIFPRRKDISEEDITRGLNHLSQAGLILYYKIDGDSFIQICQFREGQEGFRYDREKPSTIPAPFDITPATDGGIPESDGGDPGKTAESGLKEHGDITPTTAGSNPPELEIEREIEKEKNSPLPPRGGTVRSPLDCIIDFWNEKVNLPKSPMACNLPNPGKLADIIVDYGPEYVKSAIDNLSENIEGLERQFRPGSIKTFLENSVSRWHDFHGEEKSPMSEEEIEALAEEVFQ